MKLNPDCMRDVLLEMEKVPFSESLDIEPLCNSLPQYTYEDIVYSCYKLKEANFIQAIIKSYDDELHVISLDDITYSGHQFLADIRSDTVWNHVKEVGKKVGSNSVSALTQIATGVITAIIKQQLGFI